MSKVGDLHRKWSRDPDYLAAYAELGPEFELARTQIKARQVSYPLEVDSDIMPAKSGGAPRQLGVGREEPE